MNHVHLNRIKNALALLFQNQNFPSHFQSALLDCMNSWHMNMDSKMFNLVVFLDLKKAFDTVNHDILVRKLELYGITGNALSMIKSYLINRS